MAKQKKKKKPKLSPEQKEKLRIQRSHIRDIRRIFATAGFQRIANASDKQITFQSSTSDIDDLFVLQNILVMTEYTTLNTDVSTHLKKKKILYDKIADSPLEFIEYLDSNIPGFEEDRGNYYSTEHYRVVIIYCSITAVKKTLKTEVPRVRYLDFHIAKYFSAVAKAIRQSVRFELLKFLGLDHSDIGDNSISASTSASVNYEGSILPEGHSNLQKGYKVLSFYVDPEALLQRCYVLRMDRWEEKGQLYQRMIRKGKIEAIRRYLLQQKRVFVNNIIVTLPSETKIESLIDSGQDASKLLKASPVRIRLPLSYNSVGLIDGQHRVFSYYEGGVHEQEIQKLRKQQNLLVTGIVYPPSATQAEKTKFEATLFLEINSTQTKAKSGLRQEIEVLLHPFSPESIAKEIVSRLNDEGPLANAFERYFFDTMKLKTTSVVSYGVRPIVRFQGDDTLFKVWNRTDKDALSQAQDTKLLEEYLQFSTQQLSTFLGAVRSVLPEDKWTSNSKVDGRLLTTTNVNGWIVCLRQIIEHNKKLYQFDYYRKKLDQLSKFNFKKYRSSQYGSMGEALYKTYFT